MVRYFQKTCPERERCISYQDLEVHTGTIYRAAGWVPTVTKTERYRERTSKRPGSGRLYRWNVNGNDIDAAPKTRWEKALT
jgi:hypothetical protein